MGQKGRNVAFAMVVALCVAMELASDEGEKSAAGALWPRQSLVATCNNGALKLYAEIQLRNSKTCSQYLGHSLNDRPKKPHVRQELSLDPLLQRYYKKEGDEIMRYTARD